jgi:hypothetical protein
VGTGHCDGSDKLYLRTMNAVSPKSVGLGGDGDEIAAIDDVEHAFGVTLDKADAQKWHTAGDVYLSLCNALPKGTRDDSDLWVRFTEALAAGTGMDPQGIEKDSPLLAERLFWTQVANASAIVCIIIAAGMIALVAWALL